jgi:uncharacterized coiled-coil DUF342 family protein
MNGLLKRLKKIEDECVEKKGAEVTQPEGDIDEFTRLKRKVAQQTKNIRQLIKDRDELEKTAPGTVATVEISHQIRSAIKDIRNDAAAMDKLQKAEKETYTKKNKENPDKETQIEKREEIVGLVFDHIEEIRQLDQKRHGDSAFSTTKKSKDPLITELPDIDDGGFQQLRKNDQVINNMLDGISSNVNDLKEIAHEMGKEINKQGVMLDDLDVKVDKVNDELENINLRLRKALDSIRKGDRFIVDIILLCILLGLCGYIYSIVKK